MLTDEQQMDGPAASKHYASRRLPLAVKAQGKLDAGVK